MHIQLLVFAHFEHKHNTSKIKMICAWRQKATHGMVNGNIDYKRYFE